MYNLSTVNKTLKINQYIEIKNLVHFLSAFDKFS